MSSIVSQSCNLSDPLAQDSPNSEVRDSMETSNLDIIHIKSGCGSVLVRIFITVKSHHEDRDSYKAKHLVVVASS